MRPSFPRKRESSNDLIRLHGNFWAPAYAGATADYQLPANKISRHE